MYNFLQTQYVVDKYYKELLKDLIQSKKLIRLAKKSLQINLDLYKAQIYIYFNDDKKIMNNCTAKIKLFIIE